MPRNSPREGSSLLIASISGRALAEAARRAGFTPLVADFFADADTQDAAHACRKLTGMARGFRWRSLYPALSALAELAPSPVLGVVYGAGFEDRPELLRLISRRWPLLGTGAAAVARLKSPEDFFATLDRLGGFPDFAVQLLAWRRAGRHQVPQPEYAATHRRRMLHG